MTGHDGGYEVEFDRNGEPSNGRRNKPGPTGSLASSGHGTAQGPVDLDELFADDRRIVDLDDETIFSDASDAELDGLLGDHGEEKAQPYYYNPNRRLLDNDVSLIPGSPFSKPANRVSIRPKEPLSLAKYASVVAFLVTIGWVGFLFFVAIWNYNSIGRVAVEFFLAILAFFGLFWNSYFIVSSMFKCFIPKAAFVKNTKYCSVVPESKPENSPWLDVTIQIPIYKESLSEVLMPTLKSCMASRDYYIQHTGARCNIVVCDDGMMNFLLDNFPAAEMLWETIVQSKGRIIKLSKLLKSVPSASRRHLKGLRSKNVYEVFHRMLFYYHYDIGFVARMTIDRRGKFKKASNLNSHLRLALGAAQLQDNEGGPSEISFIDALLRESHNDDGSRYVMFGNDVKVGHLIVVNDGDARMAESVILKTVPEFLNDNSLGFTQHATKTMTEQRGETYYTNLLTVYTDALYQGHFLLSSIMGCHPPLVGHSIFLRTEAVKQVGRMRTLRKAQLWLRNIGLPFLPVDQIGFANLHAENRTEYWSESHVSEDFELMLHLYNLGFDGRYCAYPNCEFQEGITRTFDEEAGRHRKFALGAHELCFNPFNEWIGRGILTPLFGTFMRCDIPSYYKVFLTAYLCSYTSGGAYIIVFTIAAVTRILDNENGLKTIYSFSPAGIIILNILAFYVIGYITFLIAMVRMYIHNKKLFFPEYRKKYCGICYLIFVKLRYCLVFQFMFYTVASITFFFLGSMDHLLARPGVVSATNKDSIDISRFTATWEMIKFNLGSYAIALTIMGLAYVVIIQEYDWDVTESNIDYLQHALFSGPPVFLGIMCFISPIVLNPYVVGWPFLRKKKGPPKVQPPLRSSSKKHIDKNGRVVDIKTFMHTAQQLDQEMERVNNKPDFELGSLATKEFNSQAGANGLTPQMHASRKQIPAKAEDRDPYGYPVQQQSRPGSRPGSRHNRSNPSRPVNGADI